MSVAVGVIPPAHFLILRGRRAYDKEELVGRIEKLRPSGAKAPLILRR